MREIYDGAEAYVGVQEVLSKIPFPPSIVEFARHSQDPELMLNDPDRIDEFIDAYLNISFSDEGRFTLMFVILDSFNSILSKDNTSRQYWNTIKMLLKEDGLFFSKLIIYYASVDYGRNLEDAWPIAPYMRSILIELVQRYPEIKDNKKKYNTLFLPEWDYFQ
ncbi:hypothetical protein [Anaerosporobacter sp.]|uniref:hypothetical protein n=1 Tax=Anaerosporobacter sp. TaxID=1872529 RepID=UPI00286EC36A|nr:hypothetical protein [Anaerosporobacter sp.]